MSKPVIKNATLFVTVLGACLGLMAAGASSHAHQTASGVLSEIAYRSTATASYRHASGQSLSGFTAICNSTAPSSASHSHMRAARIFYRNTNPLIPRTSTLVVTRLARASLDGESRA